MAPPAAAAAQPVAAAQKSEVADESAAGPCPALMPPGDEPAEQPQGPPGSCLTADMQQQQHLDQASSRTPAGAGSAASCSATRTHAVAAVLHSSSGLSGAPVSAASAGTAAGGMGEAPRSEPVAPSAPTQAGPSLPPAPASGQPPAARSPFDVLKDNSWSGTSWYS
jgi:hypothetical protein